MSATAEAQRQADQTRDEARKERLRTALQQAWRSFCEDYEAGQHSVEHALEAIGEEVESWANESGHFHAQERIQMSVIIYDAARDCGRLE